MTRVALDATVSERLRAAAGHVEPCHAKGNVIGCFLPHTSIPPDLVGPTPVVELKRRVREDPRLTTREALDMLREE